MYFGRLQKGCLNIYLSCLPQDPRAGLPMFKWPASGRSAQPWPSPFCGCFGSREWDKFSAGFRRWKAFNSARFWNAWRRAYQFSSWDVPHAEELMDLRVVIQKRPVVLTRKWPLVLKDTMKLWTHTHARAFFQWRAAEFERNTFPHKFLVSELCVEIHFELRSALLLLTTKQASAALASRW